MNNRIKNLKVKAISLILSATTFLTGCNMSIIDTKYGLKKALILGDDSAIILDINKWKDYQGEQLQITTNDNFVVLTSSFDSNLFFGDSTKYSAEQIAQKVTSSDDNIYHLGTDDNKDSSFNKDVIDTYFGYNKVATFNKNNAIVMNVVKWNDYDGEQLQIITADGLILNLSSYNSKLFYDSQSPLKAQEFAKSYVGNDGKVKNYSIDTDETELFNKQLLDLDYSYNKAIIFKDNSAIIVSLDSWRDYEGEQLQLSITNGPTIVTAAYDTILLNDNNSTITANEFAENLCDGDIHDYTKGVTSEEGFNKLLIDLKYGFSNAIISNDDSSTSLNISQWCDYEGEQLQIILPTGDVILTSSMLLDLVNGGNKDLNASVLSKNYVSSSGKNIDNSNNDNTENSFNKTIIDFEYAYKYALKITNGNVTILPLKKWKDYSNDDEDDDKTKNCEQIQLILPDDTILVTSAYDTVLVKNEQDIETIAEYFRSENGVITNLESVFGKPTNSVLNITLFDTHYNFTHAILEEDGKTVSFPIKSWMDFKDGEQLQIKFDDNTGMVTSYVNTTLVLPNTKNCEEILAASFRGEYNPNKSLKLN